MTIREILKMGDPRLLQPAREMPARLFGSEELALLIDDMLDTMKANGGVGLAAPQIGVDWQLVVFGVDHSDRYPDAPSVPRTVLINPVITPLDATQDVGWEGCLSVPGMRGEVPRWSHIRYTGVDQSGAAIAREVDGFHARVVQHECDHLIGTLYPMRMTDLSRFGFSDALFPQGVAAD